MNYDIKFTVGKQVNHSIAFQTFQQTFYHTFLFPLLFSLSLLNLPNSRRHLANANVIADVKSKIIESRRYFFGNMMFSATSKVQNYQNKTGEKYLYPSKYVLTTYFKEF